MLREDKADRMKYAYEKYCQRTFKDNLRLFL